MATFLLDDETHADAGAFSRRVFVFSSPILRDMKMVASFMCGALLIVAFNMAGAPNPSQHVYELRMYHVNPGKMDALRNRFRDHVDGLFRAHHMKSIGYWTPEDAPNSENLFIYVLEHPSREEATKNWDAFHADAEWNKVKADTEANGALVDHIDSIFMDPTTYSPQK